MAWHVTNARMLSRSPLCSTIFQCWAWSPGLEKRPTLAEENLDKRCEETCKISFRMEVYPKSFKSFKTNQSRLSICCCALCPGRLEDRWSKTIVVKGGHGIWLHGFKDSQTKSSQLVPSQPLLIFAKHEVRTWAGLNLWLTFSELATTWTSARHWVATAVSQLPTRYIDGSCRRWDVIWMALPLQSMEVFLAQLSFHWNWAFTETFIHLFSSSKVNLIAWGSKVCQVLWFQMRHGVLLCRVQWDSEDWMWDSQRKKTWHSS